MRKIFIVMICMGLSGCVSTEVIKVESQKTSFPQQKDRQLTRISHIYVGMTYKEVLNVMGDKINIGYREDESTFGILQPITLQSPYRMETLEREGKVLNIIYYFTDIKKGDGFISQEELTPLVFEDNHLIGKGRDYLFQVKKKLESL